MSVSGLGSFEWGRLGERELVYGWLEMSTSSGSVVGLGAIEGAVEV